MAFDYRELGFFDMVFPHDPASNHLKRLPKNIKVKNYTVETGDCLCIPPWIMHLDIITLLGLQNIMNAKPCLLF